MQIIPAVDLLDGKVVRLFQGDFMQQTVYPLDPIELVKSYVSQGAKRVHMIDLDGARKGSVTHLDLISTLARTVTVSIQVGGGIRTMQDLIAIKRAGVESAILSTSVLQDTQFLKCALEAMGSQITVSVDIKDKKVYVNGWTQELNGGLESALAYLQANGIRHFIITDISKDGTRSGPDFDLIQQVRRLVTCELVIAGGISEPKDISKLKKFGIDGVIIGRALYEGDYKLSDYLNYAR